MNSTNFQSTAAVAAGSSLTKEKRKFPRFERHFNVVINGETYLGNDISMEGLSFTTDQPSVLIAKDGLFTDVQVSAADGKTYNIDVLVITSSRVKHGKHFYGAQIIDLADDYKPMHEGLVFDKKEVDNLVNDACEATKSATISIHLENKVNTAIRLLKDVYVYHLSPELILIRDELRAIYPNYAKIEALIKKNPETLSEFIKITQLAFPRKSIDQLMKVRSIINLIGLDNVYDLYVSSVLIRQHKNSRLEKAIMMHGMNAGLAAAELSESIDGISRSEAYLAGLLQNIGAVFLSKLDPVAYGHIFRKSISKPYLALQDELDLFGTTHCEAGVVIAKNWRLPSDLYKGILLHHSQHISADIKSTHNKSCNYALLMMLSNYVACSALGKNYVSDELKQSRDYAMSHLTLSDDSVRAAYRIVMTIGHKVDDIANF